MAKIFIHNIKIFLNTLLVKFCKHFQTFFLNIFLEKNCTTIDNKKKNTPTLAFLMDFDTLDIIVFLILFFEFEKFKF